MGAARSGVASAQFLAQRGAIVAPNDAKPFEQWPDEAKELKAQGVGCLSGDVPGWLLDQIALLVVSPGVPVKAIPLRYAERAGAEVIGETPALSDGRH